MAWDERTLGRGNKDWSYLRIGLYKYSHNDGHENFCDVHVLWHPRFLEDPPDTRVESRDRKTLKAISGSYGGIRVWYSGPNDSVLQINRLARTRIEMEEYAGYRSVETNLDVDQGGQGWAVPVGNWPQTRVHNVVSNKVHVWLFGPLVLDNQAYGSLFFEVTGPFRKDMVFRPLRLHGSTYHEGRDAFIPAYVADPTYTRLTDEQKEELYQRTGVTSSTYHDNLVTTTYNSRVNATFPAFLSQPATRWEWRVEAYTRNMTGYQATKKSG